MASESSAARVSVPRLLIVIFFARVVLNTGYRAVYPFLPFIASDLGVSYQSAAEIIQSRNLIGLAAPLFGPLSDHLGRRTMMLAGLAIAVLACLLLGGLGSFSFAVVAIAVAALGKAVFDPAQQAYLGDRVPYSERGRAISLSEVSWSAAALVGLPVFGIIVQYAGWRSGFFALGVVGVFTLALIRLGLPSAGEGATAGQGRFWERTFGLVLKHPVALAALLTSVVSAAGNENIGVVFGQWMRDSFLLDAVALGAVASAIGLAEFGGELVSSAWVDRIGKHRLVAVCLLLTSAAYFVLPVLGRSAVLATVALFLTFFFFEITVVAAIPLVSEALPTARATLLSLNVGAFALGRTIGSFAGPTIYTWGGFTANGWVSAAAAGFAFLLWSLFVRERETN